MTSKTLENAARGLSSQLWYKNIAGREEIISREDYIDGTWRYHIFEAQIVFDSAKVLILEHGAEPIAGDTVKIWGKYGTKYRVWRDKDSTCKELMFPPQFKIISRPNYNSVLQEENNNDR